MTKEYLFVGEKPSNTALARGWTWESGHLAARQLFDALKAIGIDPTEQEFINLFYNDGRVNKDAVKILLATSLQIVGMGKTVQDGLESEGIDHLKIVHPAARGKIRAKPIYQAHVRTALGSKSRKKNVPLK